MRQTALNFFSTDDLTLEGIIAEPTSDEIPEGGSGGLPGVVFCSPEPRLGGTMLSPVIESLTREVTTRGFVSFRFNYRGVGESQGENAVGEGQRADALAAFDMLREWPGVDDRRMAVVGYSFGASIAVHVAASAPKGLRAVVAVSPILDIPLIGIPTEDGLSGVGVPVRFLIGGNDSLTTPENLGGWVDGMGRGDVTAMALEGADRAWQTSRPALAEATASFLEEMMTLR